MAKEKKAPTTNVAVTKTVVEALQLAMGPSRRQTDVATAILAWWIAQPKPVQRVVTGEADADDNAKALAWFGEKLRPAASKVEGKKRSG